MGEAVFEPAAMVAIDEDGPGLRFLAGLHQEMTRARARAVRPG